MSSISSLLNSISSLISDTSTIQNSINSTLSDENSAVLEFERSPIAIEYKTALSESRVAQSAEITRTSQTVTAATAPTDYKEVVNVLQVANTSATLESIHRQSFRLQNINLENNMVGIAKGNTTLQQRATILESSNNVLFDENDPLRSQIDLYVDQSRNAKPSSFANRVSIIDQIENRDDLTDNTKDTLISEINMVDSVYTQSGSSFESAKSRFDTSSATYQESVDARNKSEAALRQLLQSPNFEEVKAKLSESDQATLERLRLEIQSGERPTADLEADGFANSNKIMTDALTGAEGAAPLFIQLPTMKAITDFRLRNGYSPFGALSPGDVARDAVHINIFSGALPDIEVVNNNGIQNTIVNSSTVKTLGNITIFPNNPDWLTFSHDHQYSDENPISSIANPILNIISTGINAIRAAENLTGGSNPAAVRVASRIDFIDQYQSTNKLSITVPFILFTKGDFIADIYRPLMFMTALSYPLREFGTGSEITDTINDAITYVKSKMSPESKDGEDGTAAKPKPQNSIEKTLTETGEAFDNAISKGNIGAFRFVIARRPEYLSVRHASGLFYFKLAVITNITYNFKGPWINSMGEPIDVVTDAEIAKLKKALADDAVKRQNQSWFKNMFTKKPPNSRGNTFFDDITKSKESNIKLPFAFPSIAECSITFKSVEPLFRQDWLNLLVGASDFSGQGIVRVSEDNSGFTTTQKGERINFNSVAVGSTNPPTQGASPARNGRTTRR
jgi:hypothetical protein